MTLDLFLAFAVFAFKASLSPGPSSFILLASGATFGLRQSLPLLLGISLGYVLMILVAGLAFEPFMSAPPALFMVSKVVFALWALWLAWKIARRPPPADERPAQERPAQERPAQEMPAQKTSAGQRLLSFPQALAFQVINPASWFVAFASMVSFTSAVSSDAGFVSLVLMLAAIFAVINLPSIGLYALLGQVLHRLFPDPKKLRILNVVAAVLLVLSIAPLVLGAVF
ncbi:LysE family translocator [Pelagibius sp.]|uniref:LysE family translocator n=1 Tax=Pelagibius sp. TaxID=1931238 RepID=UPI003BB1ED47